MKGKYVLIMFSYRSCMKGSRRQFWASAEREQHFTKCNYCNTTCMMMQSSLICLSTQIIPLTLYFSLYSNRQVDVDNYILSVYPKDQHTSYHSIIEELTSTHQTHTTRNSLSQPAMLLTHCHDYVVCISTWHQQTGPIIVILP